MTADDWSRILDANPSDWDARLAFATWLQDEMDDAEGAAAQVWQEREKKCPYLNAAGAWLWNKDVEWTNAWQHSRLPDDVFCALPKCERFRAWIWYSTRADAERDLQAALVKVGLI